MGLALSRLRYGQKFGVALQLKNVLHGRALSELYLPDFQLILTCFTEFNLIWLSSFMLAEVLALRSPDW